MLIWQLIAWLIRLFSWLQREDFAAEENHWRTSEMQDIDIARWELEMTEWRGQ